MNVIGFDTSNYTTSVAYLGDDTAMNCSKLLPVKEGELGLRQSDTVFHHTKSLPELSGRLFSHISKRDIQAVGVSTRPRSVEGSYMPCFLVGYSHGKLLADALGVPLLTFSHQQGHIAAIAWSSGHPELLETPHLAWHLSGGTTELLLVRQEGKDICCQKIGGTTDISAGQLIDRTGQLLGLPFPSGKHLDRLSQAAKQADFFRVKCHDLSFSLSGVQNQVQRYFASSSDAAETASFALRSICQAVLTVTQTAQKAYPGLPVVFSGGVSANGMLRSVLAPLDPIFAEPQYSTDNAMGIAFLTKRAMEE